MLVLVLKIANSISPRLSTDVLLYYPLIICMKQGLTFTKAISLTPGSISLAFYLSGASKDKTIVAIVNDKIWIHCVFSNDAPISQRLRPTAVNS